MFVLDSTLKCVITYIHILKVSKLVFFLESRFQISIIESTVKYWIKSALFFFKIIPWKKFNVSNICDIDKLKSKMKIWYL